jgi:hypothetical protein
MVAALMVKALVLQDLPRSWEGAPGMKKLAIAAVLVWTSALMACGGGDDDDVIVIDASVQQIDSAPAAQCDPVTQQGCAEGEKCAQLTVDLGPPILDRTDCVPNGSVAIGGACTDGEPGDTTGFDDCAAAPNQGAACVNNVCRQICNSGAATPTCGDEFSCARIADLLDDVMGGLLGVCDPVCDPVLQDCPIEGEACYLDPTNPEGKATCAGIPPESVGLTQGQPCFGPTDSSCFLNGCDKGFHPQIRTFTVQPEKAPCIAYCQPVDTYLVDPDGDGVGVLLKGGRAIGFDDGDPDSDPTTSIDCSPQRLVANDQECRFFQAIGFSDLAFDYIPPTYGFCTDTGTGQASIELWGHCELDSEEHLLRIFDEAGGGEAGTTAITDFCTADPAGQAGACALGCVSNATFNDLVTAYCANPPVDPSPFCASLSQRAIFMQNRELRARKAMMSRMN